MGDSCFLDVVWRANSGNNSRIQTHTGSHSRRVSSPRKLVELWPSWGMLLLSLAGDRWMDAAGMQNAALGLWDALALGLAGMVLQAHPGTAGTEPLAAAMGLCRSV